MVQMAPRMSYCYPPELSAAIALLLGNKNLGTRSHPSDGPLLAAGIALEHQKLSTLRSLSERLQSFTCMCCQKQSLSMLPALERYKINSLYIRCVIYVHDAIVFQSCSSLVQYAPLPSPRCPLFPLLRVLQHQRPTVSQVMHPL